MRVEQQKEIDAAEARIQLEQERKSHVEEQLERERQHTEFMNSMLRFTSHEFKTPAYAIVASLKVAQETGNISPEL